jgi:ribosomal protein L11
MQDEDMKVLGLEKVARGVAGSAGSLGLEVVA